MKILILLENSSESNSAYHVVNVAVHLKKLGNEVIVLFGKIQEGPAIKILQEEKISYGLVGIRLKNIDLIYIWGARRKVRELAKRYKFSKMIVHLEDNDYLIAKDRHPKQLLEEYKCIDEILESSEIITAVNSNVRDLLPIDKKIVTLSPGADDLFFKKRENETAQEWRQKTKNNFFLYAGNITDYVIDGISEVASTIEAYNEKYSSQIFLLITGLDFTGEIFRRHSNSVVLCNFLARDRVSDLMDTSIGNIQVGAHSDFDRYRFPSKLSEYLVSNSILITCSFEIEFEFIDSFNCLLIEKEDPDSWLNAITKSLEMEKKERMKIISQARLDANKNLSWKESVKNLDSNLQNLK
jgi:hypothetical protein